MKKKSKLQPPMLQQQHVVIDEDDGEELDEDIVVINGNEWLCEMKRMKNIIHNRTNDLRQFERKVNNVYMSLIKVAYYPMDVSLHSNNEDHIEMIKLFDQIHSLYNGTFELYAGFGNVLTSNFTVLYDIMCRFNNHPSSFKSTEEELKKISHLVDMMEQEVSLTVDHHDIYDKICQEFKVSKMKDQQDEQTLKWTDRMGKIKAIKIQFSNMDDCNQRLNQLIRGIFKFLGLIKINSDVKLTKEHWMDFHCSLVSGFIYKESLLKDINIEVDVHILKKPPSPMQDIIKQSIIRAEEIKKIKQAKTDFLEGQKLFYEFFS